MTERRNNEWLKGGDCVYRLAAGSGVEGRGNSVVFGGRVWIIRSEHEPGIENRPAECPQALAA